MSLSLSGRRTHCCPTNPDPLQAPLAPSCWEHRTDDTGEFMPATSLLHDRPWLSTRWLTIVTLTLMLALCATPVTALRAQDPTKPPVATPLDSAATQLTPTQLAEARREGAALGAQQGGWFGRAFAAGFLTAYIGPAIIIPAAALSDPHPSVEVRQRLLAKGPEYQAAFERGYRNQVRKKRVWTSAAGATVGMTALVGVLFLMWE
jgi:hypothetical protein